MSTENKEVKPQEAGERRSRGTFGQKPGDRRGGKKGQKRGPRKDDAKDWIPTTKLGRLVKEGKVKDIRDIFVHSIPVKEHQIIDHFLGSKLADEVMRISPVQKQTTAGQRTRFKAVVVIGDSVQHCGLGIKVASEVATAIRGAIILAKLSIVPTRKGYWGNKIGEPHTVPCKLTGKCGSVRVRLVPAPRGSGLVSSPVPKKLLSLGGYTDVFTSSTGHTKTLANFVSATFQAIKKTYNFKTPDLWTVNPQLVSPFAEHSKFLSEKRVKKEYVKRERKDREPREPREPRVPKHNNNNNNNTEGNVATTSSTDAPTTAGRGRGRGRGTRGGRGRGVASGGSSRGTGTSRGRGRGRGQARNGGGGVVGEQSTTSAATQQE